VSLRVDVHSRIGTFALRARFELPPGLNVLFGPSGAGKTRLLRLLAGLDRPTSGRIELAGDVFDDVAQAVHTPTHMRRIGMVFQQPFLLPHRSVLANVALATRTHDRALARTSALQLLERTGASDYAERRPRELSGGQSQRVALSRALAGSPRLLLLDEPFNALETPVRQQLQRLVRDEVIRSGLPALFVTHDRAELRALADHVLIAERGEITRLILPTALESEMA
jgi:ABC-type sulfate/molybdate transport systems ATPase subunit